VKKIMFPYLTFLKSLLESRKVDKMNREQLEALQLKKLRGLVAFAMEKCPFYADLYGKAGIKKENIATLKITDLPIVNKQLLMSNFEKVVTDPRLKYEELQKYISENRDPAHSYLGQFKIMHTSGTSGVPAIYPYHMREVATIIARMLDRVEPLTPLNVIWKRKMAWYAALHGHFAGVTILVSAPKMMMKVKLISILDPIQKVVAELNKFQPDDVSGYASSMEILAQEKREGRLLIRPERITCGGDSLTEHRRKEIQDAFGVRPSDSYSLTEGFGVANQVFGYPHLTVFDDLYLLEVDPKTRITNLYNHTIPIIRYENDDVIKVVRHPMYEQDPFTQIELIEGREMDSLNIINNNGEKDTIHPAPLVEFYVPGLEKFQFFERPYNTILIRVVGKGGTLKSDVQLAMLKILKEKNAEKSVVIDIETVDDIPVDPRTGKFKLVNQMQK
jgi:phenylacetate-CoA ligase